MIDPSMIDVSAFGDDATLLDTGAGTAASSARRSAALRRAVLRAMPGVDVVAGGDRVLVLAPMAAVRAAIANLDRDPVEGDDPGGTTHVIDVAYDGEDLAEVASNAGLAVEDVVAMHAEREVAVEVVGFLPGFGYLGEVAEPIRMPRRASPRQRVPAGSVAIAGRYTGIYPFASPGGWRLLGRAIDPALFDPTRDPPCRFAVGDRVRFHPTRAIGAASAATPEEAPGVESLGPESTGAALEIVRVTPHATIQDLGRSGLRGVGVPSSGAWDLGTHVRANRAVGNPDGCATLELPFGGLVAVARRPLVWSVDGEPRRSASLGDRIEIAPVDRPIRYLAVEGGFDVPVVLGSRSTLVVAGFGGYRGRRLARRDVLCISACISARDAVEPSTRAVDALVDAPNPPVTPLRASRGPDFGDLPASVQDSLFDGEWRLSARLDRTGARLDGARVAHDQPPDRAPRPVLPGAVQVTPDGTPILLGPDAAVTGGYPVALLMDEEARSIAARLRPGERLRFTSLAM